MNVRGIVCLEIFKTSSHHRVTNYRKVSQTKTYYMPLSLSNKLSHQLPPRSWMLEELFAWKSLKHLHISESQITGKLHTQWLHAIVSEQQTHWGPDLSHPRLLPALHVPLRLATPFSPSLLLVAPFLSLVTVTPSQESLNDILHTMTDTDWRHRNFGFDICRWMWPKEYRKNITCHNKNKKRTQYHSQQCNNNIIRMQQWM